MSIVRGGSAMKLMQSFGVVVAALAASSFNWQLVPARSAIHVVRGVPSHATPGEIRLEADLLDGAGVEG